MAAACAPGASRWVAGSDTDVTLPPTDRDPPPYAPRPAEEPHTGGAVGVVTTGGFEQARALAIRVLEAFRDGDRRTLEQHLSDPIGRTRPRLIAPRFSRSQLLDQMLAPHRWRHALRPDTPIDDIVDTNGIEVVPLAQRDEAADLPEGFLATDLLVTVPVREEARQFLSLTLQWLGEGRLVVRPGPDARVVAF